MNANEAMEVKEEINTSQLESTEAAAIDALKSIIQKARNTNTPVLIWRDGRAVELTADEAQRELDEHISKQSN